MGSGMAISVREAPIRDLSGKGALTRTTAGLGIG
jgi:hypothetical protein